MNLRKARTDCMCNTKKKHHLFQISELGGCEWLAPRSNFFIPGWSAPYPFKRRQSRSGLRSEESCFSQVSNPAPPTDGVKLRKGSIRFKTWITIASNYSLLKIRFTLQIISLFPGLCRIDKGTGKKNCRILINSQICNSTSHHTQNLISRPNRLNMYNECVMDTKQFKFGICVRVKRNAFVKSSPLRFYITHLDHWQNTYDWIQQLRLDRKSVWRE